MLAGALMLASPALADAPVSVPAGSVIGPALHVAALAPALRFYVDGLGMAVNLTMGPADRRETILGFSRDPSQAGIILLADTTAAKHPAIEHAFGYDRLVLRIADLDIAAARLKAAGFTPSPIRDVAMGYRMMLASDADGYKYELVEHRARSK